MKFLDGRSASTLADLLEMAQGPSSCSCTLPEEGEDRQEPSTYAELERRARAMGAYLQRISNGLDRGQRIRCASQKDLRKLLSSAAAHPAGAPQKRPFRLLRNTGEGGVEPFDLRKEAPRTPMKEPRGPRRERRRRTAVPSAAAACGVPAHRCAPGSGHDLFAPMPRILETIQDVNFPKAFALAP